MKNLTTLTLAACAALTLNACGGTAPDDGADADWTATDRYTEMCTGAPDVAAELADAVAPVTVPAGGHVQQVTIRDGGAAVAVRVCAPIAGDELRRVAEDLAIGMKQSALGETIQTVSVHAWPDDEAPEARLRQDNFQDYLHNGKGAEGAVFASWKAA
ncbi:MAG TPA: hypothetical protein K8V93_01595 [Corynebacterium pollutisoli]|nr:hypothetical protein [Corynebacterium pollutisoli]